MIIGTKKDLISYVYCKRKHYCRQGGNLFVMSKKSQIVNSNSAESKNFDFNLGDTYLTGDVRFIHYFLQCHACKSDFTVEQQKEYEKSLK